MLQVLMFIIAIIFMISAAWADYKHGPRFVNREQACAYKVIVILAGLTGFFLALSYVSLIKLV